MEFLIFALCLQAQGGCPQASQAYYRQHPEINQLFKTAKNKASDLLGPEAISLMPFAVISARKQGSISITNRINLQLNYENPENQRTMLFFMF